jgi:hypothetical protein
VLVAPIKTPMTPTATVLQGFDEAVSCAGSRVCFDRISAVVLRDPNCSQVALGTVRRLHETVRDVSQGESERAKAERSSIAFVVRDLIRFHWAQFGYRVEGREFCESPVSLEGRRLQARAAAYISRSSRNEIQSSTVKLNRPGMEVAGPGATGILLI